MRHLVPLLPILTAKHFAEGTELQKAYHKLARFLAEAYLCVETNSLQDLPKWGAKVAGQYMALEAAALRLDPESKDWHIMPKLYHHQKSQTPTAATRRTQGGPGLSHQGHQNKV